MVSGCGALGAGRSGRGGGQAACQVVMDAGWARASLMLTRARKQMVFQPERNFQGVALPQLPRPLHVGPAGLSFLFKARAMGMGKGTGFGEDAGWESGRCSGPSGAWGATWVSPLAPPPHLWLSPVLFSAPPLCPALAQPCHFTPGPNSSLSWLSSKPASRASFLSH